MGRLKGLFKYIIFSSAAAVVLFSAALPSFAYKYANTEFYPVREIDGHRFVPIFLEASDFQAIFNRGDMNISISCSSNADIVARDLLSSSYVTLGKNFTFPSNVQLSNLISSNPYGDLFIVEYPFVIFGDGANIDFTYSINLPFQYYFLGGELNFEFFSPANNISASTLSFIVNTPYDTSYQSVFNTFSSYEMNWTETNVLLSNLIVAFNYKPSRKACMLTYEVNPNILHEVSSIDISVSTISSRTSTASPVGVAFDQWIVYLNDDGWEDPDIPTYADLVTNYLDEITNLSPENEERVTELKSALQNVDSVFNDIQSGLEIDIPDVNDLQDTIDSDVLNGSSQFSSNILSPILNTNILIALFGGLFAVVTMKLILFGSGKS